MNTNKMPMLIPSEINDGLSLARSSPRHRYPKLLHGHGDELNRVFNFMTQDSYMQPHLHPGPEKIEFIHVVSGTLAVIFFDDNGMITDCTLLSTTGTSYVKVPAFTWHTYIITSTSAVTYETMMGVYNPETWKHFASWAPVEGHSDSYSYFKNLSNYASSLFTNIAKKT